MEGPIFHASAVADELTENWIEIRLHCDRRKDSYYEANKELQTKYAGDPALPTLVALDPVSLKRIDKYVGAPLKNPVLAFLQGSRDKIAAAAPVESEQRGD